MKRILPTIALLMVAVLVACVGGKSASDPIATAKAKATYVGSGQTSPTPVEVASATPLSPPSSPAATSSPANPPTQTAEESPYLLYFYADW